MNERHKTQNHCSWTILLLATQGVRFWKPYALLHILVLKTTVYCSNQVMKLMRVVVLPSYTKASINTSLWSNVLLIFCPLAPTKLWPSTNCCPVECGLLNEGCIVQQAQAKYSTATNHLVTIVPNQNCFIERDFISNVSLRKQPTKKTVESRWEIGDKGNTLVNINICASFYVFSCYFCGRWAFSYIFS